MPGPVGLRDQDPPSHTPAPTRDCQGGLCKLPGQRGNHTDNIWAHSDPLGVIRMQA